MATAATTRAQPQWTWLDRIPLILLMGAFILGTPGFGLETRQLDDAAMLTILSFAIVSPAAVALALSWRLPRFAAWCGAVAGCLCATVAVLDLAGLFVGPPPATMLGLDIVTLALGATVVWRSVRLIRG